MSNMYEIITYLIICLLNGFASCYCMHALIANKENLMEIQRVKSTSRSLRTIRIIACLLCAAAVLFGAGLTNAQAATESFSFIIPQDTLDWDQTVSVPMFNPALGTLNSIKFTVDATFAITAQAENLAKTSKMASWEGTLSQTLFRGDGSTLVDITPFQWSFSKTLAAYDKVTDFAGTSGVTHADGGTSSGSFVSTLAADLAAFTGTGTIDMTASAREDTSFTGSSGNMLQLVTSEAGLTVGVTYSYTPPPIPEPVTILSICAGIGTLSVYVRNRVREGFLAKL